MIDQPTAQQIAERKQLGDITFEAIRDGIVSGNIPSGKWLRQEEISERLGVSHTPVRQALERLIAQGLAERVPYKGVRVAELSHEEIAEIYALRGLFEPLIVRLATRQISDASLEELTQIVDEMDDLTALDQMQQRRELNGRFHLSIARASQNASLARHYEMTFNQCPNWMLYEGMYRQEALAESRLNAESAEHRAIVAAMARRDTDAAEERTLESLHALMVDLAELFEISMDLLISKQRDLSPRSGGTTPAANG